MTLLEQAREHIQNFPLKEHLKLVGKENDYKYSNEYVAESLHYMIEIVGNNVNDEDDIPMGASKFKGQPHFPKNLNWSWPEEHYFLAQFNLREFKEYDIFDVFPESGIAYLFFNPHSSTAKALYFNGESSELERLKLPEPSFFKKKDQSTYHHFIKPSRITFDPGFRVGYWEDSVMMKRTLPSELFEGVENIIGYPVFDSGRYSNEYGKKGVLGHILGYPTFLYGTEEEYENEYINEYILLYDYSYFDSYIHFWIHPKKLKDCDFSEIHVTYSVG